MQICQECIRRYGGIPKGFEEGTQCYICNNAFTKIDQLVDLFLNETSKYEFFTFLIGSSFPEQKLELDSSILSEQFPKGRSLKHHFNSLLGMKLEKLTGKTVDFKSPELVFKINMENFSTELEIKPLYVAGRYLKLKRGIPQSPWIHPNVNESLSVSEFIGIPITKNFEGKDYNFFASGREDVDVLMLGNGRPFYVEVLKPTKRNSNLEKIADEIRDFSQGAIEVMGLHISKQEEVEKMKEEVHDKLYEVSIEFEKPIENLELKLENVKNLEILQRTPNRVLRSRSDLVRRKLIYSIELVDYKHPQAKIKIKASSGTYIKEFIHGDNGRTTPSLSSILGVNIKIDYLNVLEVN
jgi:tRNA pseudouridine synthase 10